MIKYLVNNTQNIAVHNIVIGAIEHLKLYSYFITSHGFLNEKSLPK